MFRFAVLILCFLSLICFTPSLLMGQGLDTTTWYLAEGSTSGFDTYILVQNPNDSDADITITFMDQDGNTAVETTTVSANSRYTIKINNVTSMNNKSGVSTKVESTNDVGIIAERAMYWDGGGITGVDGHCSAGISSPATVWYLAEGSTSGFDTWILVQNPNDSDANVTITFMDQDGTTAVETTTVSANSRYSVNINAVENMNDKSGVSTKVESTNSVSIIAERAMYWDTGDITWGGGHCSAGVNGTATTWYLAEGSTSGYDTWILVQNPSSSDASVVITFMDQDGTTAVETTTVSSNSRYTIKINNVELMNNKSGVSTKVVSANSVGIIAERAMYWDTGGVTWAGGHCSAGVTTPATVWYLAEGSTSGYDTWVLVQNPQTSSDASVTITYMDQDGNTVQENTTVAANSRYTRKINEVDNMNNKTGVSTQIESNVGIIAERAMYWNSSGITNIGGHCSKGVTQSGYLTVRGKKAS